MSDTCNLTWNVVLEMYKKFFSTLTMATFYILIASMFLVQGNFVCIRWWLTSFMTSLTGKLSPKSDIKIRFFSLDASIRSNSSIDKEPEKKHTLQSTREIWIPCSCFSFLSSSHSPFSMGVEDTFWWRSMPRWKRCLSP